jgi:hypothetical protein
MKMYRWAVSFSMKGRYRIVQRENENCFLWKTEESKVKVWATVADKEANDRLGFPKSIRQLIGGLRDFTAEEAADYLAIDRSALVLKIAPSKPIGPFEELWGYSNASGTLKWYSGWLSKTEEVPMWTCAAISLALGINYLFPEIKGTVWGEALAVLLLVGPIFFLGALAIVTTITAPVFIISGAWFLLVAFRRWIVGRYLHI